MIIRSGQGSGDERFRVEEVDLRGNFSGEESHHGKHGFDGAGGTEGVAGGGFGGAELGVSSGKNAVEGGGFGAVVEWCAGAVGVDVADFHRTGTGLVDGLPHGMFERSAVGGGLGEVVEIGAVTVAVEVAEDDSAALAGVAGFFENQKSGALPEHEAPASAIERTAGVGGQRLQAVESGEDQFAKGVIAAGENDVGQTGADEVGGVPDGIGAAGAGVGHSHDGTIEPESIVNRGDLLLRLVVGDEGSLPRGGLLPDFAGELFAFFHAAGGGADGHFQTRQRALSVTVEQAGLLQSFGGGGDGESGGAAEALELFFAKGNRPGGQFGLGALGDAATLDGYDSERRACVFPGAETRPSGWRVRAQGGDTAEAGDGDTLNFAGGHVGNIVGAVVDGE